MKNLQWVQIMFMKISDALWQADEMYVNKKLQFNHFKKKTDDSGDFTWNEKSYQHINPDQSWALRCAVLIFLFMKLSCIKELNPSLEYTRKFVVIGKN